jgi:hypothetical protein
MPNSGVEPPSGSPRDPLYENKMNNDEPKYPAFDEAEMRLQKFLRTVEWPANVTWISAGDVAPWGSDQDNYLIRSS